MKCYIHSIISFLESIVCTSIAWLLFHVPMIFIRWSTKYINNNTSSYCLFLLYCFVDTRRTYGKQKIKFSITNNEKTFVNLYKVGGRMGFNDMMKGIISLSDFCRQESFSHKIYIKEPINFDKYFVPSSYDWRISEQDFLKNTTGSIVRIVVGHLRNTKVEMSVLQFFSRIYGLKQICVSMSAPCQLTLFKEQFNNILSYSDRTKYLLEMTKSFLDKGFGWITASFRFSNLLGDTDEVIAGIPKIDVIEQQKLMELCFAALTRLISKHGASCCLVTSDSTRFLKFVSEKGITSIYCISGDDFSHHIGFGGKPSDIAIDKMVSEYLLISSAVSAYQVVSRNMYESQFPKYAAAINDVPYSVLYL